MKSLATLNPEQKKAVIHKDGPLLIVAGAGTGKTTVITRRLAWLIENNLAQPNEILALTFTDKASEEMEERVDKLLPYGYVDLWVSTFHSFCDRLLKAHGLDIGLSTDFKLLTQTDQWLLIRQNLEKFDLDYYRPLGNPTKFIQALITHFSRLKDEEIWPAEYLEYAQGLRLNAGVREEEGGVKSVKKSEILNPKSKINSKFKIQNSKGELDVSEIARIEEVANAYHTYQQLLHENNYLDFGDLINYTLKLFRTRKNLLAEFQRQFKYILVDEFQDTNWAQYELVKLLAAEHKNLTVVGDDDQSIYKFRGASLSNILQFEKDFPVCEKIVLTRNYRSCQNILDLSYKFIQLNNPNRLEVALSKKSPAPNEGEQTFARLQAGRQGEGISKKLISQTKGQAEIKLLHTQTAEDEVRAVVKKILELKSSLEGEVGQPRLQGASNAPINVGGQALARLQDKEPTTWSDFAILVRANSQAEAFCRGLSQAQIPYQFLASRGLYTKPVILDILAYFKLLDNYHESAALYRLLNSPMFKISPSDQSRLTYHCYKTADSLYEALQKISAIFGVTEDSVKKLSRLLSFIEKHSHLAKEKNVGELYVNIIKDIGLEEYLIKKDDQMAHEDLNYLNQFFTRLRRFEDGNIAPKLRDFLQEINLELESGEPGKLQFDVETGPELVKIMTIHGAKGLEFKYVFITNLVDKRFPTIERRDPIEIPDELVKEILPQGDIHLQEERRLFYVAMTRAKQGLYFTAADNYGGTRTKKLSRFLFELGLETQEKLESRESFLTPTTPTIPTIPAIRTIPTSPATPTSYFPTHFSYSQLSSFAKCPLQYKYAYLLRIPIFGKPTFSFGQTLHSTLQKFFVRTLNRAGSQSSLFIESVGAAKPQKATKLPDLTDLLKFYEESWIDDWYPSKSDKKKYQEKGKKILKDFYELFKENPPQVMGLETNFNLRLGDYTIRGRLDRFDKIKDGIELIDYKTGTVKQKLETEDKEQLLLYQIAAEEVLKQKPVKLTYWYLDDNKPLSFLGTDQDKEKLKTDLLARIKQIKNSNFPPTSSGWPCKFCDYREICEHRAESH